MKSYRYIISACVFILLVSFVPQGKHRKVTLPLSEHLGHIQWIRVTPYHAVTDSTGSIIKGSIVSDTDNMYDPRMRGEDMRRVPQNGQPIELWMYDTFGDEIENDKYHANGKLYAKITHEYYPNGDIEQIMDSTRYPGAIVVNPPRIQTKKYTYRYDANENVLCSIEYTYNSISANGPICKMTKNIFDPSGKILEAFTFDNDTINPLELTLFRYNEKGQKTEEDKSTRQVIRGEDDLIPTEKIIFSYDEKSRVIDKATYRFRAGLDKDEKTTFDTSGRTIETRFYTRNNIVSRMEVKRFFKNLHMLVEDTYDADNMLTDYTISHFDTAKHLMDKGVFHINHYSNVRRYCPTCPVREGQDDTVMVHHIVNDEHFNVILDDTYSNDGKVQTENDYQYQYDNVGNWIDQLVTTNKKPVKIIEREIAYFKD